MYEVHLNSHRRALKEAPWPQLLALLGKGGEKVMIDLLLDCSIFTSVDAGRGNYHQLSGKSTTRDGALHVSLTDYGDRSTNV